MASLIGKTLGNYIVEGELGSGGMGVVLLARQESLDRPAVLKKIRPELREDAELAERFRREARTAAAIHHPNVVAVYDRFAWRGNEYIAQEFVDGADLSSVLKCCGPLPPRIASMIVLEVVRGLEEIHTQGTVHRDLKPQNIIVGRKGEVKIADFGLALDAHSPGLTQPGVMLGSPPYMPPEQMLGERVDARTDSPTPNPDRMSPRACSTRCARSATPRCASMCAEFRATSRRSYGAASRRRHGDESPVRH
ncbi:MAG: serine/threonine protein kinase [Deltaproteobacteria bacterium]|nr:serine/threonine protein kinase [Deltaproteobacteria bacterium]